MATLESVLKLKDSFTNTINRVIAATDKMANSGTVAASAVSGSLNATDQAINTVGGTIDSLTSRFRQWRTAMENANPTEIQQLNEHYGNLSETLDFQTTKLNVHQSQYNAMVTTVRKLENEYKRLAQAGNSADGTKKLQELQQAQIKMANLGLSAQNLHQNVAQTNQSINETEGAIAKCEKSQNAFTRAVAPLDPLITEIKKKFESLGNPINNIKTQIGNVTAYAKSKFNSVFGGSGFGGYIKAFVGIAAIKKGLEGTLGAGAKLTNQLATMTGMLGNADVGRAYFERLKAYASDAGKDIAEVMNITPMFLSTTKNTDQLMELTKIAEKLSLKNPTQGIEGAGYALNEALSGQFTSLKTRFNLSSSQLEPIKKAVSEGNFEGITSAFNSTLANAGITDAMIEGIRNSVPNQLGAIMNDFKMGFAEAGMGALDNLLPLIEQVRGWLSSTDGAQFFAVIGNGLSLITQGVTWLGQKFTENWEIIQSVLIVLAVAAAVVGGIMLISWVLSMMPMLVIIAIIAVFINRIQKLGVTAEDIASFVGGVFGVLGATVGNVFIGLWNVVVSVMEFITNMFTDFEYAISKLFYDLAIDVLSFFNSMVQGIVSGINWAIEKINTLTGSSLKTVEVNFVSNVIDNLDSKRAALTSSADVVDYSGMKMEYINGADAWNTGASTGAKLFNTVNDTIDSFSAQEGTWNAAHSADLSGIKDDTGKINKSVDIGNEQLKYLRDIAEREAINKFTNNTIVPQLEVSIGDVHKEADVDKILDKIVEIVNEALDTDPEGVHE